VLVERIYLHDKLKQVFAMKKYALIPLLFLMVSCSSVRVAYDYDNQTDFSKYKTWAYAEESLNLPIDQLNRDRILKAVETELTVKGLTKSDNPDALIVLHVKGEQVTTATATTTGTGPWRYRYGGGFETTQVDYNTYTEGTLFIIMADKSTEKIFWQGTGTKTIEEGAIPQQREKNINYSVQQILKNYPPKQ